jgi:hypothetical protein
MNTGSNILRAKFRRNSVPFPGWDCSLDGGSVHWEHASQGLFLVRVLGPASFEFEGINPSLQRASGLVDMTFMNGRVFEVSMDPVGVRAGLAADDSRTEIVRKYHH